MGASNRSGPDSKGGVELGRSVGTFSRTSTGLDSRGGKFLKTEKQKSQFGYEYPYTPSLTGQQHFFPSMLDIQLFLNIFPKHGEGGNTK
jgi:hypothetical protein